MEFNEPMPPAAGYIVYNLLMEYIDTFIYEYSHKHEGKEFPSLRSTTDVILTLLGDLRYANLDCIFNKDMTTHEIIKTLSVELAKLQEHREVFSSEDRGLFIDVSAPEQKPTKVKRKPAKVKEPPLEPFVLSGEDDIMLLTSWGITMNQLSSEEKHD